MPHENIQYKNLIFQMFFFNDVINMNIIQILQTNSKYKRTLIKKSTTNCILNQHQISF